MFFVRHLLGKLAADLCISFSAELPDPLVVVMGHAPLRQCAFALAYVGHSSFFVALDDLAIINAIHYSLGGSCP